MPTARNFFNEREQRLIVDAITKAEQNTSGEIRLHIVNFCFGDELAAAQKVFRRLRMHHTKERNGILIYVAVMSRKISVVGDSGIHEKLGEEFWETIVNKLIKDFKADNSKADVLAKCIIHCGEQLGKFFPGSVNDKNELDNAISY